MKYSEYKLEYTVIGMTALIMLVFIALSKVSQKPRSQDAFEISYEMPRPQSSFAPEFDLANREVLRNYLNPYAQKKLDKSRTKLAEAEKANKKEAAKGAKKADTTAAKKKPEVKTKIVEKSGSSGIGNGSNPITDESPAMAANFNNNKAAKGGANAATVPAKQNKEEDNRNWKQLFQTSPSQSLMSEMIQARQAGKVENELFYEIVGDLIKNQNEENQKIGIFGLSSDGSARGFREAVTLMQLPEIQQSTGVHSALDSYLMTFHQAQRLSVLSEILRSREPEMVIKATQVISEGIQKIKSGELVTQGRDQRTPITSSALSAYKQFLPILQVLLTSHEPEVVTAATTTISQIQTISVASAQIN